MADYSYTTVTYANSKDISGQDLPKCIPISDYYKALSDFMSGNSNEFLNRWLAACDTLNQLAQAISVLDKSFVHVSLPPTDIVSAIKSNISKHIYKTGHDHWVAAGRTVDAYNSLHAFLLSTSSSTKPESVKPSPLSINYFLWKPVSDGGGAPYQGCPVLLSRGSEGVGFKINGVVGKLMGPNNGYQSADRFSTKAKLMPANTVVDFYDRATGAPVLFKKVSSVIIKDPTKRYEFTSPTNVKEIVV